MPVLSPDRSLFVADPATDPLDAHGTLVAAPRAVARGPFPAHGDPQPDGTVEIILDPACWPLPSGALLSTTADPATDPAALVVQPEPEHVGADGIWRALEHVRCQTRPIGLVTRSAGR